MIFPSSPPDPLEQSSPSGTATPDSTAPSSSSSTFSSLESLSASPLLRLPPELLAHLRTYLPYPDLLSLRHTHPYLYNTPILATNRNIWLKVSWLLDRKERGLPCPHSHQTIFKTDREFCGGREVKRILVRRRRHWECAPGDAGCEVVRGETCGGGGWGYGLWKEVRNWRRWEEKAWSLVTLVLAILLWYLGLHEGMGGLARLFSSRASL